jgi:hypothetical protein
MVGEKGYELVSPNGYVFTHEQSLALMAGASFDGDHLASGGFGPRAGSTTVEKPKKRKKRSGSPVVSSSNLTSDVSTDTATSPAVETLAESTEAAMQSSAAAQKQQIDEGIQTRNVITQGNSEMTNMLGEIKAEIHSLNTTLPRSIMAAFQQGNP